MTILSPAKLNLFLHITSRRDDGYHNLQTVFRLLNWGDDMRFVIADSSIGRNGQNSKSNSENDNTSQPSSSPASTSALPTPPVRLHTNLQITEQVQDNLVIKAAQALLDYVNSHKASHKQDRVSNLPLVDIYLNKNIPTGAGLGGGSSNAATTLMQLNQLWKLALTTKELIQIASKIGADVPIFIFANDAIGEGIGEVLTPIDLPAQRFLLLTPNTHIATAKLFNHPQLNRSMPSLTHTAIQQHTQDFMYQNQNQTVFTNVFEPLVCQLSTEVATALEYLRSLQTYTNTTARMTGSGSCVFLPLPLLPSCLDAPQAKHQQKQLQKWQSEAPCPAYVVDTMVQ